MPKDAQQHVAGSAVARCNDCAWTWAASMDTDPGPCESCGNSNATVSVPTEQRTKKQQF